MRWGSSVVPVRLVSLSSQPHTLLSPSRPPSHVFTLLSLRRAHLHFRPGLNFLPPFGEACVCVCAPLVVTGILLNCFPFNEQGDHPCTVSNGPTKRPQYMRICGVISQTYLRFFSNGMRLSPEPQDMVPNVAAVTHGTPSLCRIGFALRVWPLLRLRTPRLQWFPTCTLRNWYPRPACGTAVRQYAIP